MSSTQVAKWGNSVADPFAALAVLMELPARLDDPPLVLMPAAAERFDVDRFAVHADHRRLVVERVDMAGPAVHEQKDDALGLCRRAARVCGASGFAGAMDDGVCARKKPSPNNSDVSAAAPNPQPVSQRNSRRVRPQKFARWLHESPIPLSFITCKLSWRRSSATGRASSGTQVSPDIRIR